jgi:quercetin dioxygenase-like cupin family protein
MLRLCLLLAASIPMLALAQIPPPSTALAKTFQDPDLQWGPCPDFLPEGCAIAVLHGDPSQNNADIFFKVPAKSTVPRHWHTSAERMVLVSGELHVTYDGQDTVILRPGTYAYGPAKASHKASCVSDTPCVLAIAFESPVDAIASDSAEK